jgi:hypothetical protein
VVLPSETLSSRNLVVSGIFILANLARKTGRIAEPGPPVLL